MPMPETVSTLVGAYAVLTRTRSHAVIGDEPPELGGEGLGPSPVELLQAALAHCTLSASRLVF